MLGRQLANALVCLMQLIVVGVLGSQPASTLWVCLSVCLVLWVVFSFGNFGDDAPGHFDSYSRCCRSEQAKHRRGMYSSRHTKRFVVSGIVGSPFVPGFDCCAGRLQFSTKSRGFFVLSFYPCCVVVFFRLFQIQTAHLLLEARVFCHRSADKWFYLFKLIFSEHPAHHVK